MSDQNLKENTAKGLLWGGLSHSLQQLLSLFFGIFLARILTPADYGMVGMLSVFSLIASSLQESGFTAALAKKKEINHQDYNAVFWFSILASACLYIILFFCAPLIAQFFDKPELIPLARYCFLGFLISSFGIAQSAYLFRNLKVKQKAKATLLGSVISGVIGVTMALLGFAYWGIATQSLSYILIVTLCLWHYSPWRPTFHFNFEPLKKMLSFSSKMLITNIFTHVNNNIFTIILGRFYSDSEVGFFTQANKWSSMAHYTVIGMINSVALPTLASVAHEQERQLRIFRKMLRFTAFASFPVMLGLLLIAHDFIVIAIEDKWMGSIVILQILCIGGAFIPITNLYSNLIISKGKSNIYMWNTVILGLLQIIIMLFLFPYGIRTMISVYVLVNISWLLVWQYFVNKEIKLSLWSALKDIFPFAFIAATVMTITYFITREIDSIYLRLTTKIIIAASFYFCIMWFSKSVTFRECIDYLLKKNKR